MQSAPKIIIALVLAAVFSACAANETQNSNANTANRNTDTNTANSIKDDIEGLEMLIKLPFPPEEAVWREEVLGKADNSRVPAPTDKKLTAVLLYSEENAAKIVAQARTYKAAQPATLNTEKWFPAELIAQSHSSGNDTIKGESFAVNDFLNAPYSEGRITRIEGTDYFVLELFTK